VANFVVTDRLPRLHRHALQERLAELAARLEGLQRSFECIQDCVRAYSPRLWHDELAGFVRCAAPCSSAQWHSACLVLNCAMPPAIDEVVAWRAVVDHQWHAVRS